MARYSSTVLAMFVASLAGCTSPQLDRRLETDLTEADKLGLALFRLAKIDRYLTPEDVEQALPIDHKLFVPKNPYPPMVDWRYSPQVDGPSEPFITMVRYLGPEFTGAQSLSVGWGGCTDVDRLSSIIGLKPQYVNLPQVFDIPPVSLVKFVVETPHIRSEVVGHGKNCIRDFSVIKKPIAVSPLPTIAP